MSRWVALASQVRSIAGRVRRALRGAGTVVRQVLGAPDYERYLQHVRERHPDRTPLSRADFVRERLDARYSRPGSRCC